MKFLFSQHQSFLPEKFGRVVFDVIEKKEGVTISKEKEKVNLYNSFEKERSLLANETRAKQEQNPLSKEIEKKATERAEKELDGIIKNAALEVESELSESEAKQLSAKAYLEKIPAWGEKILDDRNFQNWQTKYAKVLPNGWLDNVKIGGVVGTVVFGNTKGGILDRSKNALKWGSVVAAATHPGITGGIAIVMEKIGKVAAPTLGIAIPNLIFELINNPGRVMTAIKESGNMDTYNLMQSPIGELLLQGTSSGDKMTEAIQMGQQQPSVLRKQGMLRIGGKTELNTILDEMDVYDSGISKTAFAPGGGGVKKAAMFVAQMASHELSEENLQKLRSRIWNEEGTSGDVRSLLAHNSIGEVFRFFESKKQSNPDLWKRFQAELQKTKALQVPQISKAELKDMFIDPTVPAGTPGFQMKESKHGIRRFLSGGIGGAALSLYAISFLLVTGLMKAKGLAQTETYSKKPKEKGEKVAKWTSEKWKEFKDRFRKTPLKAIAGIASNKENKWVENSEDLKAIRALKGEDKKKVVKKFRKWRIEQDDAYKARVKEETKNLKGKEKRKKEKDIKQEVKMNKEKFHSMFDGISSKARATLKFLPAEK